MFKTFIIIFTLLIKHLYLCTPVYPQEFIYTIDIPSTCNYDIWKTYNSNTHTLFLVYTKPWYFHDKPEKATCEKGWQYIKCDIVYNEWHQTNSSFVYGDSAAVFNTYLIGGGSPSCGGQYPYYYFYLVPKSAMTDDTWMTLHMPIPVHLIGVFTHVDKDSKAHFSVVKISEDLLPGNWALDSSISTSPVFMNSYDINLFELLHCPNMNMTCYSKNIIKRKDEYKHLGYIKISNIRSSWSPITKDWNQKCDPIEVKTTTQCNNPGYLYKEEIKYGEHKVINDIEYINNAVGTINTVTGIHNYNQDITFNHKWVNSIGCKDVLDLMLATERETHVNHLLENGIYLMNLFIGGDIVDDALNILRNKGKDAFKGIFKDKIKSDTSETKSGIEMHNEIIEQLTGIKGLIGDYGPPSERPGHEYYN